MTDLIHRTVADKDFDDEITPEMLTSKSSKRNYVECYV